MDASIHYFAKKGDENTEDVLNFAVARALERKITHIVVASSSGKTGLKLAEKTEKEGIKTVVVTYHYGFSKKGEWSMKDNYLEKLKEMDVPVVSGSHALSGVERSVTQKLGGPSRIEAISEALRSLFGQGMKVCVEISIIAADAGAIPCSDDAEIIAIGGSSRGADTAVLLTPSHSNKFFDLHVREIIAMPRKR